MTTTTPIEMFDNILSKRTIKAFRLDGVSTVEDILRLDDIQLLHLRHTGRRTLDEVAELKSTIRPA